MGRSRQEAKTEDDLLGSGLINGVLTIGHPADNEIHNGGSAEPPFFVRDFAPGPPAQPEYVRT